METLKKKGGRGCLRAEPHASHGACELVRNDLVTTVRSTARHSFMSAPQCTILQAPLSIAMLHSAHAPFAIWRISHIWRMTLPYASTQTRLPFRPTWPLPRAPPTWGSTRPLRMAAMWPWSRRRTSEKGMRSSSHMEAATGSNLDARWP